MFSTATGGQARTHAHTHSHKHTLGTQYKSRSLCLTAKHKTYSRKHKETS